jgi:glycosyltransferase involved in cell wall biosynthesis
VHVLYLIDSIGTPGGAEQSLAALAPEYRRLGIRLDVAVLVDRPGHQSALRAAGAELFVLPEGSRLDRLRDARRLVQSRRPDLVHTTLHEADIVGRLAARAASVPVVTSLVSDSFGPEHFGNPSLSAWRLRAAWCADTATARLAVRMHAVSQHVADMMARRLRFPRERIDVIPRGRDPGALGRRTPARRFAVRAALAVPDDAPLVLAVARQEYPKGLDTAVRAMSSVRAHLPDATLLVAGRSGTHTPELERLVVSLDLDGAVRFLGTRDDVPDLMCAADVFILPSRREGLPGVLLEAMALETPVVASDIPQVREVVDESMAMLVPVGDAATFAAAIVDTYHDRATAKARAERSRARFLAEYSIRSVAERMLGFYEWAITDARLGR